MADRNSLTAAVYSKLLRSVAHAESAAKFFWTIIFRSGLLKGGRKLTV